MLMLCEQAITERDKYANVDDESIITIHTEIVGNLIAWINENLELPINISMIARKSGYSRWYIQRIFKHLTGQPLALYVRRQRLYKAAWELRHSRFNITDIAYKYQFDSQQSFWRAFRKEFSITPSMYRKIINYNKNS